MTTHTITLARHTAQVVGLMGVLVLGTWDSYGTEQLLLRHGPEWEGLAIDATFHNVPNDEGVTVLADTDGLVTVPPEACMRASKYATITFRGVQDGVQRISCNLPYMVLDHAQVPGANSTATPSENAQALAQMQDLRDGAVDAKNQAEAARDAAANSATAAAASEKAAASSAVAAAGSAAQAEAQKAAAASSATAAAASEKAAASSAVAAAGSAAQAEAQKAAAASSATAAAASATAAAGDAKTASDVAAGAADAKAAAVAAQKDAAASKAAAKTSEDAAAKSAADADSTANNINNSMMQIAANKEAVSQLKEDIVNRSVVNGGKNLIGNEANRLYAVGYIPANTNFTMSAKDGGFLTGANLKFYDSDKKYISYYNAFKDNVTRTLTIPFGFSYIELSNVIADRPIQFEIGDKATDFEDYVPNVAESMKIASEEFLKLQKSVSDILGISSGIKTGIAQSLIFSSFGYYKSGNLVRSLGNYGEKISAEFYNQGTSGTSAIQSLFGKLKDSIAFSETKTLYCIITSSISTTGSVHLSKGPNWAPASNPLIGAIKVKEGTHCYKIEFNKQWSDEHYLTPSDFNYVLFQFASATPFDNLVFDAYFFDNENLYDLIRAINQNRLEYNYKIIFWGDSLTAGAGGGGTTYPDVCARELGISNYLNAGVGGETANTIASRNGANNMIIPVGNVNRIYKIGELKDMYGTNILPLRQGSGGNTVNPIYINGHKCELSINQANATDPNATYTISGYNGTPIKYPTPCKMAGCDLSAEITVIFVGQNGPSFEQRLSIIDSMISKTNGKYVILTLSSGTEEQMKSQESTMLSKYGNHLFKTREMLSKYGLSMCGITPTSEDETAIANGSVPPSLRVDSVHLNANGYTALGKMLASHIRSLGYVN